MMRVLFDHQAFSMQNFGGISRYFAEMFKQWSGHPDFEAQYSIALSNNFYLKSVPKIHPLPFFEKSTFRGKISIITKLNEVYSSYRVLKGDFDIFHPTYYGNYYLNINRKPTVLTCYDMIHELYLPHEKKTIREKVKSLRNADKIIAISHNTKRDLIQHYNFPDSKIEVIHLASSFDVKGLPALEESSQIYFLFVGNRTSYKNFMPFIESIRPLLLENDSLFLYCAGGGSPSNLENETIQKLGLQHKISFHSVSDQNLITLYRNALAFFFPSLYEGFGIPVLEAMSCGCPVVASNVSSLPEVGGDAALYFDPLEKDSMLVAAQQILNDASLRQSLQKKGLERVKLFSWENTAAKTHDLYQKILTK